MMREKVVTMARQLNKYLERKLLSFPKNIRHNFVWVACHDNIHSFAQILVITGQLPQHLVSRSVNDSIIKTHKSAYHHPLGSHPDDTTLYGIGIYDNDHSLRMVRSILMWDKLFASAHAADEKAAKNGDPSRFSKRYPL